MLKNYMRNKMLTDQQLKDIFIALFLEHRVPINELLIDQLVNIYRYGVKHYG